MLKHSQFGISFIMSPNKIWKKSSAWRWISAEIEKVLSWVIFNRYKKFRKNIPHASHVKSKNVYCAFAEILMWKRSKLIEQFTNRTFIEHHQSDKDLYHKIKLLKNLQGDTRYLWCIFPSLTLKHKYMVTPWAQFCYPINIIQKCILFFVLA